MLRILKILHRIPFFLSTSLLYSFCATSITIKWNIWKPNLTHYEISSYKYGNTKELFVSILYCDFVFLVLYLGIKLKYSCVCKNKENGHHFYAWSILYFMLYIFYENGYNNSCRQWQQTKGKKLISFCPKYNIDECAEIIV